MPTPLGASAEDAVRQAITAYMVLWQDYAIAAATSDHGMSVLPHPARQQPSQA